MRKIFITFLLVGAVCVFSCGCGTAEKQGEPRVTTTSWHENVETTMPVYAEPSLKPWYDNNVNYMTLMVRYAARGDMDALESAVTARNAKSLDRGWTTNF